MTAGKRGEIQPHHHGTITGYTNYGCRCDACRSVSREYQRKRKAERLAEPTPEYVHGTRNGYTNYGCRCRLCRQAQRSFNLGYGKKVVAERDAMAERLRKAAAEVERLTVDLACMTAERDGYRAQLDTDWQATQIRDLIAAAGQARSERDEARAALDRVRELLKRWGSDRAVDAALVVELHQALDGSGT